MWWREKDISGGVGGAHTTRYVPMSSTGGPSSTLSCGYLTPPPSVIILAVAGLSERFGEGVEKAALVEGFLPGTRPMFNTLSPEHDGPQSAGRIDRMALSGLILSA